VVGAGDVQVWSPVEVPHDVVRYGDAPHRQLLQRRTVHQQPDAVHRYALAKGNVQLPRPEETLTGERPTQKKKKEKGKRKEKGK
jgi:hypothetical protein